MKTFLVHTPDFNRPFQPDGTFVDYLLSEYAIESFRNGEHKLGDVVISYYDPEGNASHSYEYGYASIGKLVSYEIIKSEHVDKEMVKIVVAYPETVDI